MWCSDLHFAQFRVQHNEGAVVADGRQHGGAVEGTSHGLSGAAVDPTRWERRAGPRRLPVRGERQLVDSASVDGLHVDRLRLQEVLHSHSAQLVACGRGESRQSKPRRHGQCDIGVTESSEDMSYRWQWHFFGVGAKPQRWGRIGRNPRLGSKHRKFNEMMCKIKKKGKKTFCFHYLNDTQSWNNVNASVQGCN